MVKKYMNIFKISKHCQYFQKISKKTKNAGAFFFIDEKKSPLAEKKPLTTRISLDAWKTRKSCTYEKKDPIIWEN